VGSGLGVYRTPVEPAYLGRDFRPYRGEPAGDAIKVGHANRKKVRPMSALTRYESRGLFPDVLSWLESPFSLRRSLMVQPMRLEDYIEDGHYVVRAELPGIDPEKQLEVMVSKGILTIHAERHEESETRHRTEFSYGVFSRHIQLPAGADEADIKASYDRGILEITVGLKEKEKVAGRQIPVLSLSDIKRAT
jgi:HSP20 family protein